MTSEEYKYFFNYRQKAIELKVAAEDVIRILETVGPKFNASSKYLLKKAKIGKDLQDRLVGGYQSLLKELKQLTAELSSEIKELDDMLNNIYIFGPDTFATFQRRAISHHNTQAKLLETLFSQGVEYFRSIERENHARYIGIEQSHDKFRMKLYEVIRGIVDSGFPKASLIDAWIDCMELMIEYLHDDLELSISRHTYIDLVEHENDPPTRVILERYFNAGNAKHYIKEIEKYGLKRRVRERPSNKVSYSSIDDDKQKKIDAVVLDSLKVMLQGLAFTDQSNNNYVWKDENVSDDLQIEKLIDKKLGKQKPKRLTDEYKQEVQESLQKLREAINVARLSFKKYTNNAIKGFEGLIFLTRRGRGVRLSDILKTDGNGLMQEKSFDELNYIMQTIEIMLRGNKPHENNSEFKQFLYNNNDLFEQDITNPNGSGNTSFGGSSQNELVLKQRMRIVYSNMSELTKFHGNGAQPTTLNYLMKDWSLLIGVNSNQIESEIKDIFSGLLGNSISNINQQNNIHKCDYFEEFAKYFNYSISQDQNNFTHAINDFLLFSKNNWSKFENPSQDLISNNLLGEFFTKLFSIIPHSLFIQNP